MRALPSVLSLSAILLAACGQSGDTAPEAAEAAPARIAVALPPAYAGLDLEPGQDEGRKCALCHTMVDGAPHGVGPNLHGLFGRTVGTSPGYAYSEALTGADFVWTPEALEQWLTDPMGFMPGTRMTFPGVYDEAVRHSLIAWLYGETGGGGE